MLIPNSNCFQPLSMPSACACLFKTLLSHLKQFTNSLIILTLNKLATTSNPYFYIKHIIPSTKKKVLLEQADQIVITGRQSKFISYKSNNFKIGLNILINRFYALKQCIVLHDMDLNILVFKKEKKIESKPNELQTVSRYVLWNLINSAK